MPSVHCVQPEGNDTIAGPLRSGMPSATAVARSTTSISGLQVPNVIDGNQVITACRLTGGTGFTVPDELIYLCQKQMATKEGIFCEPAGATALAGVVKALENGEVNADDHVVCLVTGHGFKDPSAASNITGPERGHYFATIQETLTHIEAGITAASANKTKD